MLETQISLTVLHKCNDSHEIRLKNPNSLTFVHINMNSIRNKFEMLHEVIGNNIDVLLISETKLGASFPLRQLILNGFTPPYRLERTYIVGKGVIPPPPFSEIPPF